MTWVEESNAALLTDLYELTMAASYHAHGMVHEATFDLFVRQMPPRRNFLVSCGLEQALEYLEKVHFSEDAVRFLDSLEMFSDDFLSWLREMRFTGQVMAIPEGELFFPDEPVMRITGPLIEAQLVETFLINQVTFQSMVASKAARCAIAAGDRSFVDFSPRRDHGADAALKAARAAFVGGASSTSNVLAGRAYGIPLNGTMAHSYVMAFDREIDSFLTFARDFPGRGVFLIDTFDVLQGARRAAEATLQLREEGIGVRAVRIDSGDLLSLVPQVRAILDEAGCGEVQIFVTGDLDEHRIRQLVLSGAPVDAFGVGTQLGTSADAPFLGGVYKLVAENGDPKMKLSASKRTLPGLKQVYRFENEQGYERDLIALEEEDVPEGGRALLEEVMVAGKRTVDPHPMAELQKRCRDRISRLPPSLRALETARQTYRVRLSPKLNELMDRVAARKT